MKTRLFLGLALLGVALFSVVSTAWEPTEMVEFIAPANPGGGWDTICRTSVRVLQETKLITQPMVVSNMPGGSGSVAIGYVVAKRAGDPHLLISASNALTFSMAIGRAPYTYDDVIPLAQVASEFGAFAVKADSPFQTLDDVAAVLKDNPGGVIFGGGSAPGGMDHIKVALLGKALGLTPTDLTYVPFQGGGEAVTALLGGHIEVFSGDLSEVVSYVEAGEVRVLAVLSEERLDDFPDIPTAVEQGIDVTFAVWRGLYLPPGVPDEAVQFWLNTIRQMVLTPEWDEARKALGWANVTKFGDEFVAAVKAELESYKGLLKELGFLK